VAGESSTKQESLVGSTHSPPMNSFAKLRGSQVSMVGEMLMSAVLSPVCR